MPNLTQGITVVTGHVFLFQQNTWQSGYLCRLRYKFLVREWAWGMGHGAWGIGHWALGMGEWGSEE